MGIGTEQPVTMTFAHSMDAASVEAALSIFPAHPYAWPGLTTAASSRSCPMASGRLTGAMPSSSVDETARTAGGALLGSSARFSFTTETAPRISDFAINYVAEPAPRRALGATRVRIRARAAGRTRPSDVSAGTSIEIAFSAPMNHGEVEQAFALSPAVPGIFRWDDSTMTFTPIERLASDARYAVSLVGVHDRAGNPLGGDATFSFTTRPGAQLVQSTPRPMTRG